MDIALQRRRREWEQEAICCKLSPQERETFFPPRGRPPKDPHWKQICFNCPVRLECLNYAIVHDEDGNWGGSTERERRALPRSFVRELTEIAKAAGWYEVHPDPLDDYKPRSNRQDFADLMEWEQGLLSAEEDSLVPRLTDAQQRSFDLLGFY